MPVSALKTIPWLRARDQLGQIGVLLGPEDEAIQYDVLSREDREIRYFNEHLGQHHRI